jgi:hypothetical protein
MSTEIAEYIFVIFGIIIIAGLPIGLYIKFMSDQKKRYKHHREALHKNS